MAQHTENAAAKAGSYTLGHSSAVLSSHMSRTASNSASYLIEHVKPDSKILDVGCGPGTITCDFAAIASSGNVIGLDFSADVISKAQEAASSGKLSNLTFQTGDAQELPFGDGSFDIVHAHMTLLHLPKPQQALKEMRRVCKPGGIVAIRECDWDTQLIYPDSEPLRKWRHVQREVPRSQGADPNAGRLLSTWATAAGYDRAKIEVSTSTMCYAQEDQRKWWGEMHASRLLDKGGNRNKMIDQGFATETELDEMVEAWRTWSRDEHGIFALLTVQILCWK